MISLFLSVLSLVWFIFGMAMFILVLHPLVTFMILVLVIVVYTTKWFLLQGTHLVQLLISSTTPSAPTPPPPRSPSLSSLLPSCPICLGTMKPPLKILPHSAQLGTQLDLSSGKSSLASWVTKWHYCVGGTAHPATDPVTWCKIRNRCSI